MQTAQQRPQDVIVFVIGGTTYEEARTVAMINSQPAQQGNAGPYQANTRVVVAGTGVLNSKTCVW
jgi:hypothetical protein